MASTKFIAIVPQPVQGGDKIVIKGKIIANVSDGEFSINFANSPCKFPADITYHFKWFYESGIIIENYKRNGEWMNHKECDYNSLDGSEFALEFAFQDDGIYVYLMDDDGRSMITHYEPESELSEIQSVQVWGDVEKVNELSFLYP